MRMKQTFLGVGTTEQDNLTNKKTLNRLGWQTELQDRKAVTTAIISHTPVYVLLLILLKPGLIQRLQS